MDPRDPGRYALLLRVEEPLRAEVGRLGRQHFPRGLYVYAGSALAGLGPRLARHARRSKPQRWHVDRLTTDAKCVPEGAVVFSVRGPSECEIVRRVLGLPGARLLHPGFGSSDHRCAGHLAWAGECPLDPVVELLTAPELGGVPVSLDDVRRPGRRVKRRR